MQCTERAGYQCLKGVVYKRKSAQATSECSTWLVQVVQKLQAERTKAAVAGNSEICPLMPNALKLRNKSQWAQSLLAVHAATSAIGVCTHATSLPLRDFSRTVTR